MRIRLLLGYVLVVLVSLIVSFAFAVLFVRDTIINHIADDQSNQALPLLKVLQNYYEKNGSWNDVEYLDLEKMLDESMQGEAWHYDFALSDTNGNLIIVENPSLLGKRINQATIQISAPVIVGDEVVGYLLSGNYIDRVIDIVKQSVLEMATVDILKALTIGLLIGFLMSFFMIREITQPILTTIAATEQISQGNFSMRVPLKTYRDMALLGEAVNEMASSLETNQKNQRYMLMDIAHDLRTPLSVQKATIEAFEDGVYKFDEDGIQQLKQQNTHLIKLVEDIRMLTLTESTCFKPNREPVELNGYINKITTNFSNILTKKSMTIKFTPFQSDCFAKIDPHLMNRVIQNLLQNAFQHSPQNSVIDVKLALEDNWIKIKIHDQGRGIPEDKLETIFRRYYRMKSVTEGEPEGLGLGLTISRRIVEIHGGRVYAHNCLDGGAEFVIELPAEKIAD